MLQILDEDEHSTVEDDNVDASASEIINEEGNTDEDDGSTDDEHDEPNTNRVEPAPVTVESETSRPSRHRQPPNRLTWTAYTATS